MGWCSGTEIFDRMAKYVIMDSASSEDEQYNTLYELAGILEDHDWDCQSDSVFYDDPVVRRVFKDLHPDWKWEDENGSME